MYYESGKHQEAGITHSPLYHLVIPRPIAWISTRIGTHTNLAPMSYFTVVRDRHPEMIAFCVGHRGHAHARLGWRWNAPKDTITLVKQTGVFCVNFVDPPHFEAMVNTAKNCGPEVSEAEEFDIEMADCKLIDCSRVATAPASLECEVWDIIDLPKTVEATDHHLVLGKVLSHWISDDIVQDGTIYYQSVGRLGGDEYCTAWNEVTRIRPDRHKKEV